MYGFPLLLLANAWDGGSVVTMPLAYAFIIWGAGLYLIAGAHYVRQIAGIVRHDPAPST